MKFGLMIKSKLKSPQLFNEYTISCFYGIFDYSKHIISTALQSWCSNCSSGLWPGQSSHPACSFESSQLFLRELVEVGRESVESQKRVSQEWIKNTYNTGIPVYKYEKSQKIAKLPYLKSDL